MGGQKNKSKHYSRKYPITPEELSPTQLKLLLTMLTFYPPRDMVDKATIIGKVTRSFEDDNNLLNSGWKGYRHIGQEVNPSLMAVIVSREAKPLFQSGYIERRPKRKGIPLLYRLKEDSYTGIFLYNVITTHAKEILSLMARGELTFSWNNNQMILPASLQSEISSGANKRQVALSPLAKAFIHDLLFSTDYYSELLEPAEIEILLQLEKKSIYNKLISEMVYDNIKDELDSSIKSFDNLFRTTNMPMQKIEPMFHMFKKTGFFNDKTKYPSREWDHVLKYIYNLRSANYNEVYQRFYELSEHKVYLKKSHLKLLGNIVTKLKEEKQAKKRGK